MILLGGGSDKYPTPFSSLRDSLPPPETRKGNSPGIGARTVPRSAESKYRQPDQRQRKKESKHRQDAEAEGEEGKSHRQEEHTEHYLQNSSKAALSFGHDPTPFHIREP